MATNILRAELTFCMAPSKASISLMVKGLDGLSLGAFHTSEAAWS